MRGEERKTSETGLNSIWLLVAILAVTWSGTAVHVQGIPGSLAFYSMRDGNNEIYTANPDGTGLSRLTDHSASDVDPAISQDGLEVIFTSDRTGNNDIHLVNSTGGPAWNLTGNSANDGWARWSPDGRQIVFHSNRDQNFEIYVMNADGSDARRLTDYPGVDMFPDWSPNGQEIVFRRDTDIYALNLLDDTVRRLTNASPLNQMATWSPNGQQLAFMSSRDGYPSVFVMNTDGSAQINLTPKDPADMNSAWLSRAPSWSTNGRQIYFMSFRTGTQGDTEIFVMNADGTGLQRLTTSVGVDGSPRAR
jgi:Tol biopolymer transport system component